jgi:CheY-like chemotaxis protein
MQESLQKGDAPEQAPGAELQTLVAALRESDRRKDEFLATLAHELRNPLAPVRNAIHILQAQTSLSPEMRWAAEVITRQVAHMKHLIDDLMDVSRITRGSLELHLRRLTLDEVLRCAVEETRPLIDASGHELTVDLPAEHLYLDADLVRLAQVFSNLLHNAAKYTPRGGRIVVTANRQSSDVVVSIRDNGIGIPKPMLERIFEPFVQLDDSLERSQGGLGIGLALAKKLVCQHGGTIEARSEGIGKGSEFLVRLTASEAGNTPVDAVAEPHGFTIARARARVLIADDHTDWVVTLTVLLTDVGYEVRTAADGRRAFEVAADFQPDIALLDIGMPQLNGYDIASRIRSQAWGRNVLLIAVTGWSDVEHRQRATEAGFDHYLTKPVDLDTLSSLLSSLA